MSSEPDRPGSAWGRHPVISAAAAAGRRLPEPVSRALRPAWGRLLAAGSTGREGPGASVAAGVSVPPRGSPEPGVPAGTGPLIPPGRPRPPEPELVVVPPLPEGVTARTVWPRTPPPGYLGQLDDAGQRRLAAMWEDVTLSDCYFYHRARLGDGRVVDGVWNLLGGEEEYLGAVPLAGRRVLELGPATGWLTTWMEQEGADVVGFDLGWDLAPDLLPLAQHDADLLRADQIAFVSRVQNAWWLLHREHHLSARAVYGSIYALPADLGRFDVAVFGSILLHLRDPFLALQQAAALTDGAIVVVEPLAHGGDDVERSVARWNPTGGVSPNGWWNLSPGLIVGMLAVLGFADSTVTYHQQPYRPESDASAVHVDVANFTVVARRP